VGRRALLSLRVGLIALCMLAAPGSTSATVVIPASFQEMVDASELIVHGRVRTVRGQSTEGRRSIESLVTVDVTSTIKGEAATTVTFRVPGGEVGRYRVVMVGAPVFEEGDEVVLFLDGRAPSMPMPFGLHQGVYRVSRRTGEPRVAPLVPVDAGRVVRGDPARRPVALDEFAVAVRQAATRQVPRLRSGQVGR
jgi:hypothetical protein